MANRMSLLHTVVEDLRNSSPSQLSPLRRRSSVAPVRLAATELEENDDEAERRTRRKEQNQPVATRNDKRKSLGLGFVAQMSHPQIAEKVSQCIKLSAENKINVKNAFNLEMIDFMTYMIKKQDANMSNLQMASTSLDVSTKIYGFRVDGVYTDIIKMIGGLDKQEAKSQRDGENAEPETGENAGGPESQTRNKKKRRSKQKILASAESLSGSVTTVNPASLMFEEADSQTTDLLYQAILPHHANNGLYLNDYNDVILDTVNPSRELNINATTFACPKIENSVNAEMCQSFANFEFLGYSPDDEDDDDDDTDVDQCNNEPSTLDKSRSFHDALQFDIDASLPPDEGPIYHTSNDFDTENVERCRADHGGAVNIVDFREEVVRTAKHCKESEYSYFQDNIGLQWAGPNYWKIRFAAKNLGGSRIVEGCGQEAVRRRKELLLAYDDETRNVCTPKFDINRSSAVKIQTKTARTWSEEKLILPQDMHYDSTHYCRLYLKPDVLVNFPDKHRMNATHVSEEIGDYDYNNANDTADYCPNIECDDEDRAGEKGDSSINALPSTPADFDEEIGAPTQAFTGDNLVEAPKINNKIFIPYSQRAKKIDMRQLKKCIWKDLASKQELNDLEANEAPQDATEKVTETKKFSVIYKNLPKILSKANVEALSFPIAFMSLLHLANEKTLKIIANEDNSELFIRQD